MDTNKEKLISKSSATGTYEKTTIAGETVSAFVPVALSQDIIASLGTDSYDRLERADSAIEGLVGMGIVKEITGKRRDRVFVYDKYLHILSEGP